VIVALDTLHPYHHVLEDVGAYMFRALDLVIRCNQ
jgi:hypothetical protein